MGSGKGGELTTTMAISYKSDLQRIVLSKENIFIAQRALFCVFSHFIQD